ncbi:class I SAM-dependent methyltransferase [Spirosoma oryzicola]|uniref:class I SAM-dependent methyltransferase n=1 Tax=Spirosoma oryzicola TaxID=2898794 RepID=UPI001E42047E|nr:class I SAM-dependent methyltransferase [Spirosoma oryzicola]UHG94880.1 class I SAM-dependent methyltransferase [Spirosoma oryzicola]
MLQETAVNIPVSSTHMPIYKPVSKKKPERMINIMSAWRGLELIIEDILIRFNLNRTSCIEFGVEFGYSTVALSNYFDKVIGVDTFEGDKHTFNKKEHFDKTRARLSVYENIDLIKSDYQSWIPNDKNYYDFAHVDIVHSYKETYECGLWAAQNSDCVIFHDTESFLEVRRAVIDISKDTGYDMYNYPYHFGLGILVNPNVKNR